MKSVLIVAFALVLGGCDSTACTAPFLFPVSVQALDSVKGQSVTSGLQGDLRLGNSVVASVQGPASGSTLIFLDAIPTGTYELNVRANGYLNWRTQGVVIAKDKCGLYVTQSLIARLVALDPTVVMLKTDVTGILLTPGKTATITARLFPTNFFPGRSRAVIFSIGSGDSAIDLQALSDTTVSVHAKKTGQSVVNAAWSEGPSISTYVSITTSPQ